MRYRLTLILLFFACTVSMTAQVDKQEKYILIQGVVLDAGSLETLPNAHFILNGIAGNATDEDGRFSLYITSGDTLKFTYIGYNDFIFIPSDTLKGNMFTAGIFMESDTLAIGEVIVVPSIPDLRTGIMLETPEVSQEMVNARNNIATSVYQGLNSQSELGDPQTNYDMLKRKQVMDAYEKGAIPSDRMVGINFLAIPAAVVYYSRGMNRRPEPPKPMIRQSDIERMKKIYRQNIR